MQAAYYQPMAQPMKQPIVQPMIQPIIQPMMQPMVQPITQPVVATVFATVPRSLACVGPDPCRMVCKNCHTQIMTSTRIHMPAKTHIFALVLLLFGCLPCCIIPYFMESCRNTTHTCPSCNAYIGSYVA